VRTLLLADDSVTIQRVIELTFADEDVKVVPVSDGHQAIAELRRAPPDIVLADVGMPGPNGYEVAEFIKTTPGLAHIPVVLLTGAFEPIDQVRADAIGCDGMLAKPFEPQFVIERVKQLLDRAAPPPRHETPALERQRPTATPSEDVDEYLTRLDEELASRSNGSPAEPPVRTGQPKEASPAQPPAARSLADAFAALLAAERSMPAAPRPLAPARSPMPQAGDDVIEAIAQRVIERMSERVVRETVRELALETAERLVREEIERIKSSVR